MFLAKRYILFVSIYHKLIFTRGWLKVSFHEQITTEYKFLPEMNHIKLHFRLLIHLSTDWQRNANSSSNHCFSKKQLRAILQRAVI